MCCTLEKDEEGEGYGQEVTCLVCSKMAMVGEARKGCKRKQEEQAEKMLQQSNKRFKPAEEGMTVMVRVPDVDRGRAEFLNVKAVVICVETNGLYKLGTKHGVLPQLFSRNQFSPCAGSFLSVEEVPQNVEISLREVAKKDSIGGGQGYFRCTCRTKCKSKKCKCFAANVRCNSKCHGSHSCCNKFD